MLTSSEGPGAQQTPSQRFPPSPLPVLAVEGDELDGVGQEARWADWICLLHERQDLIEELLRYVRHRECEVSSEPLVRQFPLLPSEFARRIDERQHRVHHCPVEVL